MTNHTQDEGRMRLSESKMFQRMLLLCRHPQEFYDRTVNALAALDERFRLGRPAYQAEAWDQAIERISEVFNLDLNSFLREPSLVAFEKNFRQSVEIDRPQVLFDSVFNGDITLARLCYAFCRALQPAVVLETGVANGVTSSFILQALSTNTQGVLHSIDLAPIGAEVGLLIPDSLKSRWHLHTGASNRILPTLLPNLGRLDLFVHDSLHSYRNMRQEFRAVTPHLARRSVVLADDVQGNFAFQEWCTTVRPALSTIISEVDKTGIRLGVAAFLERLE